MGDLEETIFQENVPGRWSKHSIWGSDRAPDNEDCTESQGDDEFQDNEDPSDDLKRTNHHAHVPENVRRQIEAERSTKSQTGVKGVLADAKASKALDRAEMEGKKQERDAILKRMVEGCKVKNQDENNTTSNDREEAGGSDDDEDDDDTFMAAFRERRLQELKKQQQTVARPQFGCVRDVNGESLLDELEKEESGVIVIVHLFEPSVPTCTRLNRILDELAVQMPSAKFLRMPASDNGMNLDRTTMPILSIYKAGETVAILAAIAHEIGTDFFTKEQVEELIVNELAGKL